MVVPVIPLHLGPLHPVEQVLTLVLAFGPFLLLGVVIVVRRRRDEREAADDGGVAAQSGEPIAVADPGPTSAQRER